MNKNKQAVQGEVCQRLERVFEYFTVVLRETPVNTEHVRRNS